MPPSDRATNLPVEDSVFLEHVLAVASDAIVATDLSQRILLFNSAAEQAFGYTASEVLGKDLDLLLPERERSAHRRHIAGFADGQVDSQLMRDRAELVGRRKDGELFPIQVAISKLKIAGHVLLTAFVRDVSEQRRLEASRRREEAGFRALFEHATDAIVVVDREYVTRFATPSYTTLLGYETSERLGLSDFDLLHPDDVEGLRRFFDYLAEVSDRTGTYQVRAKHADGQYRWFAMTVTNLLAVPSVAGMVVNLRDITAAREAEQAIAHKTFHDELTGLPNRILMIEALTHMLSTASRASAGVGVLFIDLDRFKSVNDNLGHGAGDQVILAVVKRLGAVLGSDDVIARLGGDEFVVALPDVGSVQESVGIAARLLHALNDAVAVNGTSAFVSASIGIVLAARGDDPDRILADAEIAMYQAKEAGRGRFEIFDPALRTRVQELVELEADLHDAVRRREFVTYFQPVVDIADETVHGVEALVRWQHPTRGLLMPDQFIPVAEESGLIVDMGRIVLADACRAVVEHEARHGSRLVLAVNVSPYQLDRPGFVPEVASVAASSGLDLARLVVEITESAVINDLEETAVVLGRLKDMGVRIAMDDFGTGFSSLTYLSGLPVDIVKIDRSFVSKLHEGGTNADIVAAICSLGRSMGLHVIAEGVETRAQLQRLRELGCHGAQGYLFGRPAPTL